MRSGASSRIPLVRSCLTCPLSQVSRPSPSPTPTPYCTLIPDFLTWQWQTNPLSVATARGAVRSELFRASADRTRRGERSRWPSLPHRPREANRCVASPVGPENSPRLLPRLRCLRAKGRPQRRSAPEAPAADRAVRARRRRRGGCTRGCGRTVWATPVALPRKVSCASDGVRTGT